MQRVAVVFGFILLLLAIACSDAAQGDFDSAAELDRQQKQSEAVEAYIKAHQASPDSHYGKLAKARAEVLLLEIGAQQLQAKQWPQLDETAGKLIGLNVKTAGNIFKSWSAYGQNKLDQADEFLKQATGDPQGVAPPTEEAIEATASALFRGATAGAKSALSGSVVDSQFLKNYRNKLKNKITRERVSLERRAELAKKNTREAMETLLDNYPDSEEAKAVRKTYAKMIARKLRSIETVGPPKVQDPDPIATLADALERVPDEKVAKSALARVPALRKAWEGQYEEMLKTIDEQVQAHQDKAIKQIREIILKQCVPLKRRVKAGEEGALEELTKVRQKAAKTIPNGLTPDELQQMTLLVLANCTPQKREE